MNDFKVNAIVEMPKGSSYKYEVNKEDGGLKLDRPLNQSIPFNYGFIPETLCQDGDPLDVFVLSHHPIPPLTKVEVNILGVLKCTDNGIEDDKLVASLVGEEGTEVSLVNSIPYILTYLNTYKSGFEVLAFEDAPWGIKTYQKSREWPNPAS
jgi:inorganic pyrophosphatase